MEDPRRAGGSVGDVGIVPECAGGDRVLSKATSNAGIDARTYLEAGVKQFLAPVLRRNGFAYEPGDYGLGHVPYATCAFRRRSLEIGLIARLGFENGPNLGCPNYSFGRGYAGHTALVWAVGHAGAERLVRGDYR